MANKVWAKKKKSVAHVRINLFKIEKLKRKKDIYLSLIEKNLSAKLAVGIPVKKRKRKKDKRNGK